ncbi:MAG: hypothetical protein ACWGQW_00800 [bacterium]
MTEEFKRRTITVNGILVELDTDVDLQVGALSGDMDKVASQMGFWGSVWASAVEERTNVDAHYRHWRAKTVEAILAEDPKLAEWKVKAKVEAGADFLKMKAALAISERNVTLAKAVFDSFDKKANQLQSKGAMSRSELDATGMSTPSKPRPKRSKPKDTKLEAKHAPDKDDPRISAMRARNSKK